MFISYSSSFPLGWHLFSQSDHEQKSMHFSQAS